MYSWEDDMIDNDNVIDFMKYKDTRNETHTSPVADLKTWIKDSLARAQKFDEEQQKKLDRKKHNENVIKSWRLKNSKLGVEK